MMMPSDPIGEYLGQLRAGLRVPSQEAGLILAEAEDHLRQTAAAGLAAGLTEREAQEAAISSFGSVRAVIRAHEASRGRAAAVLGEAGLAAWKLVSILLLAGGVSGLLTGVIHALTGPPYVATGGVPIIAAGPGFRWLAWSSLVAIGAALLAGYGAVRLRQRRRGLRRGPLLAGLFPVVAASFFTTVALTLFALNVSATRMIFDPGLVVVTCLALGVGYGARMARARLRKG
jgi:hypothetical protein